MIYPDENEYLNQILVEQLEKVGTRAYLEEMGLTHYLNPEGWLMTDLTENADTSVFGKAFIHKFEYRDDMSAIALHETVGSFRVSGQLKGNTGVVVTLSRLREGAAAFERESLGYGSW